MIQNSNQGRQTEMVKKKLISMIREGGLNVGDQLPSQAVLRERLGVGSKTIQRALQTLAEDGVVELRKNRGVFLLRTDAGGNRGRKIGLVCMRLPNYVFGNLLLQALQFELHDRGADSVCFLRDNVPLRSRDPLDLFPGLETAIRRGRLDGLISTVDLDDNALDLCRAAGVPLVYYGPSLYTEHRFYMPEYIDQVFSDLGSAGCKRHAVIASTLDQKDRIFEKLHDKYPDIRYFCNQICENTPSTRENLEQEIVHIVDEYCALPPEERPDGIYIPDDFLTAAFCSNLLVRGYPLPKIITHRTKQIPVPLPFPLLGWIEIDILEYARKIVDAIYRFIHKETVAKEQLQLGATYINIMRKESL